MQPPECKSCGHRHWQIEGCGPAEGVPTADVFRDGEPIRVHAADNVPRQVYEDLKAYEATQAQQHAAGYMQAAPAPALGDILDVLPVKTVAGIASNAPCCLICHGTGQDPQSKGIADCEACHGSGLAHSSDMPKRLSGLAAATAPLVMTEDGAFFVHPDKEGAKRLVPVGVHIGFPLGGTSGDGVALTSTAHPLGPPPYTKEGAHLLAIRQGLKLSQPKFSAQFGVPVGTLRGWESGRHKMPPYFLTLLRVIEREPKAVFRALGRKE